MVNSAYHLKSYLFLDLMDLKAVLYHRYALLYIETARFILILLITDSALYLIRYELYISIRIAVHGSVYCAAVIMAQNYYEPAS